MASSKWGPDPSTNDPTKMAQASMQQMSEMWDMLGQSAQNANKRFKEERDYQDVIKYDLRLKEAQIQETIASQSYKEAAAFKAINDKADKSFGEGIRTVNTWGSLADDAAAKANNPNIPWQERSRAKADEEYARRKQKETMAALEGSRSITTPPPSDGVYTAGQADTLTPPLPSDTGETEGDQFQPSTTDWNPQGAMTLELGSVDEQDAIDTRKRWDAALTTDSEQAVDAAIGEVRMTYAKESTEGQARLKNLLDRKAALQEKAAGSVKQTPVDKIDAIRNKLLMSDYNQEAIDSVMERDYDPVSLRKAADEMIAISKEFGPDSYRAKLQEVEAEAELAANKVRQEALASKGGRPDAVLSPAEEALAENAKRATLALKKAQIDAKFQTERSKAGLKPLSEAIVKKPDAASQYLPSKDNPPAQLRQ